MSYGLPQLRVRSIALRAMDSKPPHADCNTLLVALLSGRVTAVTSISPGRAHRLPDDGGNVQAV